MKVAVYPGSFDPITFGHLDVLGRAAEVFDRDRRGRPREPSQVAAPAVDQRIEIINAARDEHCQGRGRPDRRRGLHRAHRRLLPGPRTPSFIIRGLRAIRDFETELQLGHANRDLAPEIDTVFFMTSLEQGYVSSSLVKEIAQFGGPIERACARRRRGSAPVGPRATRGVP